ncbi:MAG: rhodanese-like domain-containing protein, partial [Chloroflexota bacterium]
MTPIERETIRRLTISNAELQARLGDPIVSIVDVRPLVAYNGWRRGDEARGGHVPGAVAFPIAWLDSVDEAEIERLLGTKGLVAGRDIVVYGDGVDDAEVLAARLEGVGVDGVRILPNGAAGWAADGALPLERLPNYEALVHIAWLREVLEGGRPEAAPDGPFLLFHVNFGVPEEYAEGHIPGALYLDTDWLEDPADWNRRSPEAIDAALRSLGIAHDTTVVLYGRDTEGDADEKWPGRRAGQIAATRALMILRYAGVDDVRLLDGGYDWWVRDGNPLETTDRQPVPVEAFGVTVPLRPEVIVDIGEAKAIIGDPEGAALVSVRTWREHIGNVSGYNYIGPAGRIKGDVWGNCGTDAYHMQHYRNIDNTMRAYTEIAANWDEAGITPDKWVAFYCGTGWR